MRLRAPAKRVNYALNSSSPRRSNSTTTTAATRTSIVRASNEFYRTKRMRIAQRQFGRYLVIQTVWKQFKFSPGEFKLLLQNSCRIVFALHRGRAHLALHAALFITQSIYYAPLRLITKITENRVIPIYARHLALRGPRSLQHASVSEL